MGCPRSIRVRGATIRRRPPHGLTALHTNGRNDLNTHFAGWETGRYDRYPWMVLGWVAARRGEVAKARTQMAMMVGRFTADRGTVTINELGFYQRIVGLIGA
ncbi:hypothetical protein V4F39_22565 [Aquincola sp. MAHUQ-54]|uniref:Uncharacterized protein n=1 Tax=Aquincola agrisoli TaxID=3119538 RepID=A0AAW9QNZ7_9BURK